MANEITVCVLTPTFMQGSALPAGILAQSDATYNLKAHYLHGGVFGDSPDEWQPFHAGESIYTLLKIANLKPISVSKQLSTLATPVVSDDLLNRVQLYILDPLFFEIPEYKNNLLLLVGAICGGNSSACVVVPGRAAGSLIGRLRDLRNEKLNNLKKTKCNTWRGRWEVSNREDLLNFLDTWRTINHTSQLLAPIGTLQYPPVIPQMLVSQ